MKFSHKKNEEVNGFMKRIFSISVVLFFFVAGFCSGQEAGTSQSGKTGELKLFASLYSVKQAKDPGSLAGTFSVVLSEDKNIKKDEKITAEVSSFYSLLSLGQLYDLTLVPAADQAKSQLYKIKKIVKVIKEYPIAYNTNFTRKKALSKDLRRIRKLLEGHGSWNSWQEELKPFLDELWYRQKDEGKYLIQGRRFFHRLFILLRVLGDAEHRPNIALECLTALDKYLKSKNIDLILVPVPFQEEIYAANFSDKVPADGISLPSNLRFMQDLLRADIEMIDLAPALKEANRKEVQDIYYNNIDHHPASRGVAIIAQEISKRLARYNFKQDLEYVYVSPDLYPSGKGYEHHEQYLSAEAILTPDLKPLKLNENSPIYIVGDSNTRIPNKFGGPVNTQIAYQIARFTGVVPKLSTQIKSTKVMRGLLRNGKEKLLSSKVVVFLFHYDSIYHTKEFVYSDWELLDLEKEFASMDKE